MHDAAGFYCYFVSECCVWYTALGYIAFVVCHVYHKGVKGVVHYIPDEGTCLQGNEEVGLLRTFHY